ncbi:MAG: DNA-processing protein DprA [Christensenellales bacterium]
MLESEAMAILVGAGVSYGRREAALRAAGSALAILAEPGLYAAQLQEKGLALLRHALADEARLLDGLAKKKMALVLREDAQYPPLLRQIAHPPHLLYVYGETDLTDRFPVAVVGTRRASAYGLTHTREIAAELAQTGVCVVSGLALGIDAAAHTGALDGGGRTVAVLGSALDKPYPQENDPLMQRILESGGSVVSEYAPGTPPSRYSFLQRNRIIAGMCLGTLVTEGPRRSGALNTATRTLENGREVFALPGNVDSPGAQLPNMLISEGARLVTGAADILSALVIEPKDAPKAAQAAVAPMEAPAEKKSHIPGGLDETQRAICVALLAGEADFDALCAVSGLGSDELGALLIEMEMDGLVTPLAGTRYAPGTQMTG